jgi:hypothetical protein
VPNLKLLDSFKNIGKTIWEAFLNNAVVLVMAFIFSGGYLVAINKIKQFQIWVRDIPTDYVLTPLVLLLVVIVALIRINQKQKKALSKFLQEPLRDVSKAQFVTHLGVWWKINLETEYIEDFPYCACCEPRLKLVQIEHRPEIYKCSKTNTEYKLYDTIPRNRDKILKSLYSTYFDGLGVKFYKLYSDEFRRLRKLNPDIKNIELCKKLFEIGPLSKIPESEKQEIFSRNENPMNSYHFVERHFSHYKKYFKLWRDEQLNKKP